MIALVASLLLLALAADPLAEQLARAPLPSCTVGFCVADAATGEVLYAKDAGLPLAPASSLKVVTTAAAVSRLGADHHFTTRLLSVEPLGPDGVVPGDLILLGDADPCLRRDALAPEGIADPSGFLADLLLQAGVRRIDGQLVLDDGLLDRQGVHPAWDPGDLAFLYAAPVSALSVDRNCLALAVDGTSAGPRPRAQLETLSDGYQLRNELRWATKEDVIAVGAERPDDGGVVRVRGSLSRGETFRFEVPVRDGGLLFGTSLLSHLRARGIPVRGGLAREAGVAAAHADATELVRFETPLSLAVLLANKESDNSISDHLFKLLGARFGGEGSFAGGSRAVLAFLRDTVGTVTDGVRITDGSGLADSNRITARNLVDVLVSMHAAPGPERTVFLSSLAVAGLDGSIRDRLEERPYRGAVRAKNGWITGVSTLAGFAVGRSGRVLAFAILVNGQEDGTNRAVKAIQDDLCRVLVDRW